MGSENNKSSSELWAEFRFGVVGRLLSSPPRRRGELRAALKELAERTWRHPVSGELTFYSLATIERWYYRCRMERGSVIPALKRKTRRDVGQTRIFEDVLKEILRIQHREHPGWSYKLHADNLKAEIKRRTLTIAMPSVSALRRWMQGNGMFKTRRCRGQDRLAAVAARDRVANREVRSFENEYVGGLWHLDFHHCSRQVLLPGGVRKTPVCVAVLDDHSRLACHVQWYLNENTENLVHAFGQAVQKRGLPRALLTDNGSPMMSAEFTEGLLRLGILHETTLPYSPYQNGKQERFFGVLEGRLLAMLENLSELTLSQLNEATVAWVELEYQRAVHEEIKDTPLNRFLSGNNVTRSSSSSAELRLTFRREVGRKQRRTDGTLSLEGKRFELPAHYRCLTQLRVRYAQWDLSFVHLVDPQSGALLCSLYPLDKAANAAGLRRTINPSLEPPPPVKNEMAPLLQTLMADYAATGMPPAYLPKDENQEEEENV